MSVLPVLLLGLLTASSHCEATPPDQPVTLRFLDDSVLIRNSSGGSRSRHEVGNGMELRANRPTKLGLIYKPTEPWEVHSDASARDLLTVCQRRAAH